MSKASRGIPYCEIISTNMKVSVFFLAQWHCWSPHKQRTTSQPTD